MSMFEQKKNTKRILILFLSTLYLKIQLYVVNWTFHALRL